MTTELPKGFKCETCGKRHDFSLYVYAHSRDVLTHECHNCGAWHAIHNLRARQTRKGVKPLRQEPTK